MAQRVNISCLCGSSREQVVLNVTIPIDICHCNICRWTTGTLIYAAQGLLHPPQSLQHLIRYNSSERVSRYFCGNCGTHVYHYVHRDDEWHVSLATVTQVGEVEQVSSSRAQRIAKHQFVADTVDGGLAICLAEPSATFYMRADDEEPVESLMGVMSLQDETLIDTGPRVRAACHCGGVEFWLSRPDEKSRECSSPWPDLIRPYYSCDPANPEDEKWWIRGSNKFLAGTCSCRACRLSSSSPITCWGFIPRANLFISDGSLADFDFGTLKTHHSSEGRTRAFCNVCGASIFLRLDFRPDLIDVSLGLFRASEGARAETWFEWYTKRVSFAEDAIDEHLINVLESGLKILESKTT